MLDLIIGISLVVGPVLFPWLLIKALEIVTDATV